MCSSIEDELWETGRITILRDVAHSDWEIRFDEKLPIVNRVAQAHRGPRNLDQAESPGLRHRLLQHFSTLFRSGQPANCLAILGCECYASLDNQGYSKRGTVPRKQHRLAIDGARAAFRLALFRDRGRRHQTVGETAMQPVYSYTQAKARAATLLHQVKHAQAAW
jgi:hypothetical protein